MSDSTDRPDWRRMKPADFGARTKVRQDALFLVDQPDACGTEALDGLRFGVALWADPGDRPASNLDA
ncbi:hypothetical protein [Streptomyces sp. NBC_01022]|uniref:hypothetical protein n=1 Tax=Streptomyces sp. NBC_01022 TaxID=2903723 RepID=UPI002DDADED3|nr:hypothetical protein [Streptomyces sp. NBC_01022]WRZ82684.1 hypothetical protein OG316_21675 [Streptomyces sp. NBC_01022]